MDLECDPYTSDGTGTSSRRLMSCPTCGIPTRVPAPNHLIKFPEDVVLIEEVVTAEFNTYRHFCGGRSSVVVPVVAVWANEKRAIVVAASREDLGAAAEGWSVAEVAAYPGLQEAIIAWIDEEGRALWASITDDDFTDLDRAARIAVVTPLRLLAWALELEGARRGAATPDETQRLEWLTSLYIAVLKDHLQALALQAGDNDATAELLSIVSRAVPSRCLTAELLQALASDCDDEVHEHLLDRHRMAMAFRKEWINACAHSVAGVDNPRQASWAELLAVFWAISRLDNIQIDERFFLTPAALQATMSFDALLAAALSIGLREPTAGIKELTHFFNEYSGLFAGAAFDSLFVDWYQELFTQGIAATVPEISVHEMFAIVTSRPQEGEWKLGRVAAGVAERWTMAFPGRTREITEGFAKELGRVGTTQDMCHYVTGATEWLNRRREWMLAFHLVKTIHPQLDAGQVDLPPGELVNLWNEVGNTFRYVEHPAEALAAYAIAEQLSSGLPDEESRLRVVTRNRAIVLRDYGNFSEAEAEFARLAAAHPNDPEINHSMAVFYDRIGEWEKGLALMDRALASPLLVRQQVKLFLGHRAECEQKLGRSDAALADVRTAWRMTGTHLVDERLRLASIGIRCRPTGTDLAQFREGLLNFVLEQAASFIDAPGNIGAGALAAVAEEALAVGDTRSARHALEIALPEPRSPETTPAGQLAIDWAWLRVQEGGPEDALPWLMHGLLTVEQNVPTGGEAPYALSWVRGANTQIDRVLELAPRITSDPSLLAAVYEMANGRELGANVVEDDETPWGERLAAAAQASRCDIVLLLDGAERLTLVVFTATGGPPHVRSAYLSASELEEATRQLLAFDRANPVAPHRIDVRLAGWWRAAGVIAELVRPLLSEEAEVVFLPGRRLASSPLHLAGWPATPLIAERPVSVCPNARVLLGDRGRAHGPVGVVVVPKAGDTPRFKDALREAAEGIAHGGRRVRIIADEMADEDAVLALAEGAAEIAFLCHGVSSSGSGQGPGICVAASGLLPPSTLPIDSDPDLARFALSWSDLSGLRRAPDVVVSMACSTGRSQIGSGGTWLGLEQGLFTRGTAAVISPLWNIDQEPSLTWLRLFYEAHRPGATEDLSRAYQFACLQTRQRFPHPFAWGPFILTRRLTKEHR